MSYRFCALGVSVLAEGSKVPWAAPGTVPIGASAGVEGAFGHLFQGKRLSRYAYTGANAGGQVNPDLSEMGMEVEFSIWLVNPDETAGLSYGYYFGAGGWSALCDLLGVSFDPVHLGMLDEVSLCVYFGPNFQVVGFEIAVLAFGAAHEGPGEAHLGAFAAGFVGYSWVGE